MLCPVLFWNDPEGSSAEILRWQHTRVPDAQPAPTPVSPQLNSSLLQCRVGSIGFLLEPVEAMSGFHFTKFDLLLRLFNTFTCSFQPIFNKILNFTKKKEKVSLVLEMWKAMQPSPQRPQAVRIGYPVKGIYLGCLHDQWQRDPRLT